MASGNYRWTGNADLMAEQQEDREPNQRRRTFDTNHLATLPSVPRLLGSLPRAASSNIAGSIAIQLAAQAPSPCHGMQRASRTDYSSNKNNLPAGTPMEEQYPGSRLALAGRRCEDAVLALLYRIHLSGGDACHLDGADSTYPIVGRLLSKQNKRDGRLLDMDAELLRSTLRMPQIHHPRMETVATFMRWNLIL
jgi:hypothetical protein